MLPPVFYVQQLEQILLRKLLSPPTPAARPLRPRAALRAYVRIQFFVRFFRVELRPLISRVCAAPPDALTSIFSFCQPFPFQAAPLWLRVRHILFSRFSVFLDPYFRRFYDFFLRRKHLESLVRVIRPFGVHMCATKAKKFSGLTFSPAGL